MTDELDSRIAARAREHGLQLGSETIQISRYLRLLARWNERMNLTALQLGGFPDATLDRLVMEPLAAAQTVPDSAATWLDVGSGGGSPAIPLKLVIPRLQLTMVESSMRKAAFLGEVVRTLSLPTVSIAAQRLESLPNQAAADLVTLRAVRADEAFQLAVARLLRAGGHLLHFHSETSQIVDWKGLVKQNEQPLPSERGLLTIWQRHASR